MCNYLYRADTDWLLENDPGDALQQGRRGQRPIIGPIIQRSRKKNLWVKVRKCGLLSLKAQKQSEKLWNWSHISIFNKAMFAVLWTNDTYLGFNGIQGIQNFLKAGVGNTNLQQTKTRYNSLFNILCKGKMIFGDLLGLVVGPLLFCIGLFHDQRVRMLTCRYNYL